MTKTLHVPDHLVICISTDNPQTPSVFAENRQTL